MFRSSDGTIHVTELRLVETGRASSGPSDSHVSQPDI